MSVFGKKKVIIPAGDMINANREDSEQPKVVDLPNLAFKEAPKEPLQPRAYSEEEIALLGDLERYKINCQGAFSKEEFLEIPDSVKNLLFYEMLFSIWRELRELNETIKNLNKEE